MSQIQWVQAQLLLDAGVTPCPQCASLETGRYCRLCGTDKLPETVYRCDTCQLLGEGPHCTQCGGILGDYLQRQLADGTFDLEGWKRDMAPFLQGFTEAEKAALRREGLPIPGEGVYDHLSA